MDAVTQLRTAVRAAHSSIVWLSQDGRDTGVIAQPALFSELLSLTALQSHTSLQAALDSVGVQSSRFHTAALDAVSFQFAGNGTTGGTTAGVVTEAVSASRAERVTNWHADDVAVWDSTRTQVLVTTSDM